MFKIFRFHILNIITFTYKNIINILLFQSAFPSLYAGQDEFSLPFQKLNKLNKCFALVTLLPFSKKKMNYCQGSHRIKRPCKQKNRRLSASSH